MPNPSVPRAALLFACTATLLGAGMTTASADPTPTASATPTPTGMPTPTATPAPTGTPLATPSPSAIPVEVPCAPIDMAAATLGARWGATGSFSRYHTGLDFAARIGTPVLAAAAGVVQEPRAGGWAGTHVVILHVDGSLTVSAHLSTASVRPGERVRAGQQIGAVGVSGRTFGPHLHFEHYPTGVLGDPYQTDDPLAWLQTRPCERRLATTPTKAPTTASKDRTGGLAATGA